MKLARHVMLVATALSAASPAATATLRLAGDGTNIASPQADGALALDRLVIALDAGETLAIADQQLNADAESRAMISLSSEFLTVAVTHGRIRMGEGPWAGPGQALLLALDGNRVQRLAFDAARLSATLSAGARPLIGEDVERLAASQRRGAFWGVYEPLRVNARAPAGPVAEPGRAAYLSEPAIARQRRQAAGVADAAARGRAVAAAFVAAYAAGDADTLAGLIDPEPFVRRGGPDAVREGRRRAAATLLADAGLGAVLGAGPAIEASAEGGSALIAGAAGRWRLSLVVRDRAIFVAALEPAA